MLINSVSPKQGAPDRWIVIKGRRLNSVDIVYFFNGEGYDPIEFLHLDNQHIGTYVPDWAETGFLLIEDTGCSHAYSPKKFVVL